MPENERKIWYVPEGLATEYPIRESEEVCVELFEKISKEQIPLCLQPEDSKSTKMFIRKEVWERIKRAVSYLQKETQGTATLKITDAFRPLERQRIYFNELMRETQEKQGLEGSELWEYVTQFVADPNRCPPHSTGGALDCTVTHVKTGNDYDMGSPMNSASDASFTWDDHIQMTAQKNRQLLYTAMRKAGCVNLPTEWWHYSYGDQYWAIFEKQKYALYGSKETVLV